MILSASQVKDFVLCSRKWAWSKIAGLERPQAVSAELGVRIHTQLEKYLRDAEPLDPHERMAWIDPKTGKLIERHPGVIAEAGLHLLPPPKVPGLLAESQFHFQTTAAAWTGYIDFQWPNPRPQVGDHKSTGDLRWALTPDQLATDVQGLLYAVSAYLRTGEPEIGLNWIYYETTPRH